MFAPGDFVMTPAGTGLVSSVLGANVSVGLSGIGNFYGYTLQLTLLKGVG